MLITKGGKDTLDLSDIGTDRQKMSVFNVNAPRHRKGPVEFIESQFLMTVGQEKIFLLSNCLSRKWNVMYSREIFVEIMNNIFRISWNIDFLESYINYYRNIWENAWKNMLFRRTYLIFLSGGCIVIKIIQLECLLVIILYIIVSSDSRREHLFNFWIHS